MKYTLVFLLGLAAGIYGTFVYERLLPPPWTPANRVEHPAVAQARDAASHELDAVDEQRRKWHLTSSDIKRELEKTGQIVREQAHAAGVGISDVRVLSVIKAKYLLDRDLSPVDIKVEVTDGHVALSGTVANADLIGRAVALAMETNGVYQVESTLKVSGQPAA